VCPRTPEREGFEKTVDFGGDVLAEGSGLRPEWFVTV